MFRKSSYVFKSAEYPELNTNRVKAVDVKVNEQPVLDFKKNSVDLSIKAPMKEPQYKKGWVYITRDVFNKSRMNYINNKTGYELNDEDQIYQHNWNVMQNMFDRWEKNAADFIELYGIDEYEKNYKLPDSFYEDEDEDENENENDNENLYDTDDEYENEYYR